MKETKLLGGGGGSGGKDSNSEDEKSRIEQIEEEVKTSIFSVFYLLLKNNETSYWKFVIILIIEYIQLLSFSFDDTVSNYLGFVTTFIYSSWINGWQKMWCSTSPNF